MPYYQGDAVEKDAILTRIDDSLIQAELNKAKANLKQARVDVKRIKSQTTARRNIPFAAIRHDSQGEFLFRISPDNTVESIHVQTGILLGNQVDILEGLNVDERVVVKGFIGLRDGN